MSLRSGPGAKSHHRVGLACARIIVPPCFSSSDWPRVRSFCLCVTEAGQFDAMTLTLDAGRSSLTLDVSSFSHVRSSLAPIYVADTRVYFQRGWRTLLARRRQTVRRKCRSCVTDGTPSTRAAADHALCVIHHAITRHRHRHNCRRTRAFVPMIIICLPWSAY